MSRATVILGDSPQALIAELDRDLAAAPLAPFIDEQIVVQSLGMERWVGNELALRQGCVGSVRFPFPAGFCHRLARDLQRASVGERQELDPRFDRTAITWRVFALLDDAALMNGPECATLRHYLDGAGSGKRFALAQRIATQFDDYQLYRSDVLLAWEAAAPAAGEPAHVHWQACLWRTLTAGEQPMHLARWFTSTIERLEGCAEAPGGLPARVSVFGVATLPPLFIRLLQAVARFAPVRYYVLSPDPAQVRDDVMHPLARAFGGTSRELLALLSDTVAPPDVRVVSTGTPASQAALHRLQSDIRAGTTRRAPALADIADGDRSLSVHVCHSPVREMEVLHDQLLDAFAADPTLRPHDILVMVPDTNVYAPLAASVFGDVDAAGTAIPYRIADRAMAVEVTPARALLGMLALVRSRVTASEVMSLLHIECVARAARIPTAGLDRIARWLDDAAIRWGWNAEAIQEQWELPAVGINTWQHGLDRLLLGYATGQRDSLIGDLLPVAGDTLGDATLLGALAQWVSALCAQLERMRSTRTLPEWSALLQETLAWLVEGEDADERTQIDRVLATVRSIADARTQTADDGLVPFEVVEQWLSVALSAEEYASGFLRGGVTVAAIKPMRAIPFRIIAMLGLDDSAFPRRSRRAAFDLVDLAPRAGDRDARADDRQLFLDTLLCAGDRLILSYVGRSQKNNSPIAPSVVISELLNEIDLAFARDASAPLQPAHARLVVEHPLQPFSPRYFDGSDPRLFSFNARIAQSVAQPRRAAPVFVSEPSPTAPVRVAAPIDVTLHELVECWMNPARLYCERTLGIRHPWDGGATEDSEPMEIDALHRVKLQQRVLERHLAGHDDTADERALALARGDLPSGALAPLWDAAIRRNVDSLLARVGRPAFAEPVLLDVRGEGWHLTGRLDGLVPDGRLQVRAATLKPRDRVRAWVSHIALTLLHPDAVTHLIALDSTTRFAPPASASAIMQTLVDGYRRALQAPLPFFLNAAEAYERTRANARAGSDPLRAAQNAYASTEFKTGDTPDPFIDLCWRGRDPIAECVMEFAALATAFWGPMLQLTQDGSRDTGGDA